MRSHYSKVKFSTIKKNNDNNALNNLWNCITLYHTYKLTYHNEEIVMKGYYSNKNEEKKIIV